MKSPRTRFHFMAVTQWRQMPHFWNGKCNFLKANTIFFFFKICLNSPLLPYFIQNRPTRPCTYNHCFLCVGVFFIRVLNLESRYKQSYVKYSNQASANNLMPTVVLSKVSQRWWKDENPTVGLSNLTRRWRGTENPTVVMPYLVQRRLKNGNPTVALPTLILRWFNVVKTTPTYSRPLRPFTDVGSTSPCRLG